MKIDGRVKGGLAWAGLFVVLAVPAADMLFGKPTGNSAAVATTADAPVATGAKAPALKPAVATDPIKTASVDGGQAVDKYLKSGKKLPSYISDADEVQPSSVSAPTSALPATVTAPTAVASVPAETPPVPLPRSARPKTTQVASLPAAEEPLIINEPTVKSPSQQATVERFPMSDGGQGQVVTGDQLEEWDSGSLADYLERKGLMSEDRPQASGDYDPDGFYLDEGPNRRPVRRNLDFFLF